MIETLSEQKCFGGTIGVYRHPSAVTGCAMRFSLFRPPQANAPLLTWLSGLTCTEDNFTVKAGAYRMAARLGLAILAPDTSPRGDTAADDDAYDLGKGAGFYLDATQPPWATHYRMESYVTGELNELVTGHFDLDRTRQGIFGHSMGGHGALVLHFRHPDLYRSVSAFSPIVAPMQVPWGQKAFSAYLGDDHVAWADHDATELVAKVTPEHSNRPILIDQGLADQFLETQLRPELFRQACAKAGQSLDLRLHEGYDHSYFFIQSFIDDQLRHHGEQLLR